MPTAMFAVSRRDASAAQLKKGGNTIGIFSRGTAAQNELGLTDRQTEILQLIAQGKSTGQIADELRLSKTTVRNHIAHLMARLGVHTRVHAVVVAARSGLI